MRKSYSKSILTDFPCMLLYLSTHHQPLFSKIAGQHTLVASHDTEDKAQPLQPVMEAVYHVVSAGLPNSCQMPFSFLTSLNMPGRAGTTAPGAHFPFIPPVLLSLNSSSRNCLCHSLGLSHMGRILTEWFHTCVIYLTNQTGTPQIGGPWVEFSPHTCFVWPTQCFWRIWISCQHLKKISRWHIMKIWISDFSWQTQSSDKAVSAFQDGFNQLELRNGDPSRSDVSFPLWHSPHHAFVLRQASSCSLTEHTVSSAL